MAPSSSILMSSSLRRFQASSHDSRLAISWVFDSSTVSMILQLVGAQRGAGLGHFHDGVGQHRRLHFGGAPTEFHLGRHAVRGQVALGGGHQLGGDDLAFQVLHAIGNREASGTASTQRTLPKLCLA